MLMDAHADQRAKERYGKELTDDDRAAMVAQIQEGRAFFLARKHGYKNVKFWIVWWPSAEQCVPVLYAKKKIRTVLPKEPVTYFLKMPKSEIES